MSNGQPVPSNQRDLDIYVEHRYAPEVAQFLESVGYTYGHRSSQEGTWRAQMVKSSSVGETQTPRRIDVAHYPSTGIQDILDFYYDEEDAAASREPFRPNRSRDGTDEQARQLKGTKIQLITSKPKRSPADVILTFHSSKVTNQLCSGLLI